jgi:hypothetical protein
MIYAVTLLCDIEAFEFLAAVVLASEVGGTCGTNGREEERV